jgi:filamentous hemagglutinin family protein
MKHHTSPRRRPSRSKKSSVAMAAAVLGELLETRGIQAGPAGMTVESGTASAVTAGHQLQITASHNAALTWQSFNIGAGETARFIQPSSSSVVWNRVLDANPSQIYGRLEANGIVVLMNQQGFHFGPNSFVSAAGLVVSTAPVQAVETSAGLFWQFSGAAPQAGIVNYGHLNVERGGSLFLIGNQLDNHGTLNAPDGRIGLLSGQEVMLSSRPDGLALSAAVKIPAGAINNSGVIQADAGTIAMHAQVVNQDGLVQANSVRERNGVIELVASDSVHLGSQSTLSAQGGAEGASRGGQIVVKSAGEFSDVSGSRIDVAGGAQGGDAGHVEVSAAEMTAIRSTVNGSAQAGYRGGQLLIDPQDIVIGSSGSGSIGSGTVGSRDTPAAGTLNLDVNTAFLGFSQITLQATRNITIAGGTLWDLGASTGLNQPGSLLKLEAGNNITIATGASILAPENWSVTLQAGRDFTAPDSVRSGVGNIAFSGSGSLQAHNGDVSLLAGNNITVGNGFVRTVGGGDISARALAGNINTGTRPNGFLFRPNGYEVDPELGGISTANGGDVTLNAGQDVISSLPFAGGNQSDGGSGAFGIVAGNVSVTAGRDVQGHFVVRNGSGSITAGRDAGVNSRLLALSLVNGGWSVAAGRDILLQEVRNPNGVFNNLGSSSSPWRHLFDYSAEAFTVLQAVNSVQLRGTGLPRYSDAFEEGITPIYPGRLEISAGAGGVVLGNDVTLFPSPSGDLSIVTTDGGSLVGTKNGDLAQLIVSDSGKTHYREFGDFGISDHAPIPVHLNDTDAVTLDVDGDMSGILLGVPKRAEINVGGDLVNSRFDGQNLRNTDVTSIHVAGDIINRNEFTSVVIGSVPNFGLFDLVYPALPGSAAGVQNLFSYNATTHELTFQGRMTGDQLQALKSLRIRTFDSNGLPIVDGNGEPVTVAAQFASPEAIDQLYANSQDVPLNPDTGYRLGGGGTFDIRARDLDLGATVGIVSQGPRGNAALANLFTHGADINVVLGGDLDMFSTKIASLNGGDISVVADGAVNVGSRTFSVSDASARGIFTTDRSDVTVIAGGDINVNGSRIAAYDGGNVTVRSLNGDVDAGTGASGVATVEKIYVDPVTREILSYAPTIPGSGILATTFPRSLAPGFPASRNTVGDILIETPKGDIIASAGGVVQLPLNGVNENSGNVTLRAGTRAPDGTVIHEGNIDASGSGVIGSNVKIEATGDIDGVIFARDNLDLKAVQNVSVIALAGGRADVGGGGTISGTIIGVGSVNVSGATVDAALLSQNISASGDVSSAQTGFAQGAAAASTSQSQQGEEPVKAASATQAAEEGDDARKKPRELPVLARTVGRVTVILPNKN